MMQKTIDIKYKNNAEFDYIIDSDNYDLFEQLLKSVHVPNKECNETLRYGAYHSLRNNNTRYGVLILNKLSYLDLCCVAALLKSDNKNEKYEFVVNTYNLNKKDIPDYSAYY